MSDDGTRRVEVEVSEETYERLERVAETREQSIEDSATEAIEEYAQLYDPDDPILDVEPGGDADEILTARKTDEYLYGSTTGGEQ